LARSGGEICQIDGGGGFANPALDISNCNNLHFF
jgi:hypothetical protein